MPNRNSSNNTPISINAIGSSIGYSSPCPCMLPYACIDNRTESDILILPGKKYLLYFTHKSSYVHGKQIIFAFRQKANISLSIDINFITK